MFELNPHTYGSTDYYKHEMETANRNLNFVVSGAGQQIKDCNLTEEQEIIISACEAVVLANESYKSAIKRYEEAKAKEGKPNE